MGETESFEIWPLRTLRDFEQAEDVQRHVWKLGADTGIVPLSIMLPISKNGGVVLGAFSGNSMLGICLGFLGRSQEGHPILWSHMNGVLYEKQGLGLGERLKWAQREAALATGVDLIRWTMDPLEGRNASLNFGKLGVTCRTYERNIYGSLKDGINAGIESDRFVVDWDLDSRRVRSRLTNRKPIHSVKKWEVEGAKAANLTIPDSEGIRRISELRLEFTIPKVMLETPASFQDVKRHNLDLAIDWREKTRGAFEFYFEKGYVATDFVSQILDDERRNFFLLERS